VCNPFARAIRIVLEAADRGGYRAALIGGFALDLHRVRRTTGDVDFLVEEGGAEPLLAELQREGMRLLHRSAEVANLESSRPEIASVDLLFARREPTLAMLDRAQTRRLAVDALAVPVVDVEGIIGLKAPAVCNDPRRRRRDEQDIVDLLTLWLPELDLALLRGYFSLLEADHDLERLLTEAHDQRAQRG
jgi:hypothetical protein